MKKFKYIAVLAALFTAMACSETEVEGISKLNNGKQIQVVGRVLPFTDCNVNSRSIKTDNEINISCMSLVIFDDNGKCVHLEYINSSSPVFVVNREDLADSYEVSKAKMYVFANTPEIQPGETFQTDNLASYNEDTFLKTVNAVSGIDIPKIGGIECFPMVGKLTVDLETAATEILEIPLYALYAKIVMNIKVTPDQSIPGKNSASFRLDGYTVHNVASSVDFKGSNVDSEGKETVTSDATPVLDGTFEGSISGSNIAQGATDVQFSFYLPERYLQPETTAAEYNYPFPKTNDGYRKEDSTYMQRFKPCLVEKNVPAATFVRFFGEYIDHQGHNHNVSYDIYVGSDNYGNFDVVRNTQYNNYITIRGLANSNDQVFVGEGEKDPISIDHRVDVERVNPIIINFRRETLLDSHFEVRPIRIRKNPEFKGSVEGAKVKVEVVYNDTPASNWIGLERSFGNGKIVSTSTTYLVDNDLVAVGRKNSAGKRKYFTTDLTTVTLNKDATESTALDTDGCSMIGGKAVIVPVTDADQCIWMYVDECTEAADDVRSAKIRISYSVDGKTWNEDHKIDYIINQRKLFPVTFTENNTSRNYNIEYHEEYLYNYDAEDSYGQTENEGMKWGLNNAQLSYEHNAIYIPVSGFVGSIINAIVNSMNPQPKYDFYLKKHDNITGVTTHEHAGLPFNKEILVNLATKDNDTSNDITVLSLGENPNSAIEYCFNKNKRNGNGEVVDTLWYLPASDEIEDIVMSKYNGNNTYTRFQEFQEKFYWSCQPAYIRNYAHYYSGVIADANGVYFHDDTNYARATKVIYSSGEFTYEESGATGYKRVAAIDRPITDVTSTEPPKYYDVPCKYTYSWLNRTKEVTEKMVRQSGNLHRENDMARVRCVKKTTTSN